MDPYVTGAVVRAFREKNDLTQLQLAEILSVSDKTVSKWETGKGYPDITLLEPIAKAFHISLQELLSGCPAENANLSASMLRSQFYVCPVCGNIIHAMGGAAISCHGIALTPAIAEQEDDAHHVTLEPVEDELYVTIDHPMTKDHYISFIAAVSPDRLRMVKLYPEGNAEARFKNSGLMKLYYYCNRDGLFCITPKKHINK